VVPDTGIHFAHKLDTQMAVLVVGGCSGCWRMGSLAKIGSDLECSGTANFLHIGVANFDKGRTLAGSSPVMVDSLAQLGIPEFDN